MTTSSPPTPYAALFTLVREKLWPPDGKPPVGWDERREGSVLKRLLMHKSRSQVEVAIIGLARLRDSGQVEWLKPGAKVTSRALYNTRSGVSQVFELATREYWMAAKKRPKQPVDTVGEILFHSLRQTASYRDYLASPEWRGRRAEKLRHANYRCERCGALGQGLEVHHLTYDRLGHELETDLQVLCPACHKVADVERVR